MQNLILLRMWRERRSMTVLFFSLCLVTGFLALAPLYVTTIAAADFDQRIETADNSRFQINVQNEAPIEQEFIDDVTADTVIAYTLAIRHFFADGDFECGRTVRNGEEQSLINSCYRPVAYTQLNDIFNIVEGKMPSAVRFTEDRIPIIEALTTAPNIQKSSVELGDVAVLGQGADTIHIQIVGVAESAIARNNAFWDAQTMLDIFLTPNGFQGFRSDLTLAVSPDDYVNYIAQAINASPTYNYRLELDRASLSSRIVDDLEQNYQTFQSTITNEFPEVRINTWFSTVIADYRNGIAEAQFPVILLSALVMVLMLYNIYAIASLILEQQSEEWAIIASRGASTRQLVWIQFSTVLIMGVAAFIIGPLMAYLIMVLLSVIGPQANILEFKHIANISLFSYMLSGISAAIAIICLTLPSWSAANRSLSRLKQGVSRPPTLPSWSRFYLDFILLGIGFALILRLYVLSTGNSIDALLSNPFSLITLFASQDVSDFTDAFNLAVPALLLTGASLLWMRIFPSLMRLIGQLVANGNGLTTRLAFWNVERDPAHYAQLVLLLIGTLALGTASIILSNTREIGAWQAAQQEVGADVRVSLDASNFNREADWNSLPTVTSALPIVVVETGNQRDGAAIGIDIDNLDRDIYPELYEVLQPITEQPEIDYGGLEIPEDAIELRIDVYSEVPAEETDEPLETRLNFELMDIIGEEYVITLTTEDETVIGEFNTYSVSLENVGIPPYTLLGLQWRTRQGRVNEIQQTSILDNLVAIDGEGNITIIEAFEPDTYGLWQWSSASRLRQVLSSTAFSLNSDTVSEGVSSLEVLYTTRPRATSFSDATMTYRERTLPPLPIVVSSEFAKTQGLRSRLSRPLEAGDTMSSPILIPFDRTAMGDVEITYTVAGVYDDLIGYNDASYFIGDLDTIRRWVNSVEPFGGSFGSTNTYDINTILLTLDGQEPTPELINAIEEQPDTLEYESAWTRFTEIQREPLANAITGMLFTGFWISLTLGLMDFAFYLALTIRRRALSFATLRAIGWSDRDLLALLSAEQAAFIAPALIIGVVFGVFLAYLILPFLALIGEASLQIPWLGVSLLVIVFTLSFIIMLRLTARILQHMSINKIMRFGE